MERPSTPLQAGEALGGDILPPGAEPLKSGDPSVVGGHRLTGRLASGGTSVVYLARDDEGEPVVVKTTRARQADETQARRRLRTEAACSRRLPPFCTARLLADGSDQSPPYLVSEYVEGPSLGQYVEVVGLLDAEQLLALAFALARAISAVHDAGLIHCDLRPGNVLLAADGPRVIDFSIAQAAVSGRATEPGTVPYGPGWVAPERLDGHPAGMASDVFGWGCLIGYAATGRSPFGGEDASDLAAIEEPVRGLVEAALAADPAGRPSIGEIAGRLDGVHHGAADAGGARPLRRHETEAPPAWSPDLRGAVEPMSPQEVALARSPVDAPTAPMAHVAAEPAHDPAPRRVREPGHAALPPAPSGPADDLPPRRLDHTATGHTAGPAADPAAADDADAVAHERRDRTRAAAGAPAAASLSRADHRARRPRRLRTAAMITAPAALVAVLATAVAMAGSAPRTRAPSTPAGAPATEQAPGPAVSPSAPEPHRRSYGPRPASASSAREGSGPPVPAHRRHRASTHPGRPGGGHGHSSPPVSSPSPTPTHTPSSPTPTPTVTSTDTRTAHGTPGTSPR